jgi:hypothetical protein
MVEINAVHYNSDRIHKMLRITPAMTARLSERVFGAEEVVQVSH